MGKQRTKYERPSVEPLEGRALLSLAHPVAKLRHGLPGPPPFVLAGQHLNLSGSATGQLLVGLGTYNLNGTGQVSPLGSVRLSGTVQGIGFVSRGNASGTIQLANSRGSVTLSLVGPLLINGPKPPPSGIYQFSITGGTGAYAGAVGSGTADVNLAVQLQSFSMTFRPKAFRA